MRLPHAFSLFLSMLESFFPFAIIDSNCLTLSLRTTLLSNSKATIESNILLSSVAETKPNLDKVDCTTSLISPSTENSFFPYKKLPRYFKI